MCKRPPYACREVEDNERDEGRENEAEVPKSKEELETGMQCSVCEVRGDVTVLKFWDVMGDGTVDVTACE